MPVCAAVCDFFTDGAAVCTNMPEAATLLFRKKESAEVGRDPAVSMLNLANNHNSYSNKSYRINIFRPITS